jgi:AAA family ATP:ADP antiporter
VVLPLRDEAALSLGTGVLPALFLASLELTMLAALASSYLLSLPNLPKGKVSPLHEFYIAL